MNTYAMFHICHPCTGPCESSLYHFSFSIYAVEVSTLVFAGEEMEFYTYIHYLYILSHYGLSQKVGHSSLCHTVGSCYLSILNVRPETIKVLEENIGRAANDMNQIKIIYNPPPRIMEIKTKVNKWDLIKLKCFCTAKEMTNKVKRLSSEWEKIIANETTDKGLISKIYKQLVQLNTRRTNNPINKLEKHLNRHFSKKDIQMAKKHMKRCSTSLIIREIQIKTAMRHHLTSDRMTIIKKSTNNKRGESVEKRELCYTVGGNAN